MKSRHLFIGCGIAASIIFIFLLAIIFARTLLFGKGPFASGGNVGIIEVKGMITESKDFIEQLHQFRDNKDIKAVILRIDSPGGVVGPSQEMYEEIKKFSGKKILVVSMGSLAASGGYYIAAPANKIFANPGTVTGSIGVLMKLANIQGLMEKVGLNSFVIKSGKFKDSGSPIRPMTKEDEELLQGVINNMHMQFIRAVAEGRKLPLEDVKKIADGRILSGEQALALKLVDRLGNLQDAIEEASKMAGIEGKPEIVYPKVKKRTLLDFLIEGMSDRIAEKLSLETDISARYELSGNPVK